MLDQKKEKEENLLLEMVSRVRSVHIGPSACLH